MNQISPTYYIEIYVIKRLLINLRRIWIVSRNENARYDNEYSE